MSAKGVGGPKDFVEARTLFKFAADRGHARSCFLYGYMLKDGAGGDADLVAAADYLTRAKNAGIAEAANLLWAMRVIE